MAGNIIMDEQNTPVDILGSTWNILFADKDEAGESGNKASEGKQYKTKDEDINIESDNDLKDFIKGIHTKKTKIVRKVDVM